MKKLYLLFAAMATFTFGTYAQCTINPALQTTPGVYPTADNLPCIERTVFYDQTLQGKIQTDTNTTVAGFPAHIVVDSMRLDSVVGLPAGITFSKSPNVLPGGGNGCVRFFGTTTAPAGRYPLQGWGTVWLHITVPAVSIDTLMANSGNLNQFSPFGGYYVDVINQGSGCRGSFGVSLGVDTGRCYGDTITLHVATANGQAPYTYQWSTNGSALTCSTCASPSSSITQGTKFIVTVTDANFNVASDTITVIVVGAPINIIPSGPANFCQGDSVILDATSSFLFGQYLWSDGTTTAKDTVRQSGTYSVLWTALGGCPFRDTIVVTVNPRSISNYQITASGPTSFCGGGGVTLNAGGGFASYHWSPGGAQTSSITVTQTNNYTVTVTGNDGCIYTDAQSVNTNTSFSGQGICVVSVDQTTGKNVIVWEKTTGFGIDSFKVYKETSVTGVYQMIRQQRFGNFSTYEDGQSNPAQQSERYVITTLDACGESAHSVSHKTIHLTSNVGINSEVNLIWNAYEGFTYPSFNIYRGPSQGNMTQLTQVSSSTFSYTDLTPPAPPLYYQIEVLNPQGCVPTAKTESYSSSLSNVVLINSLGVNKADKDDFKVISIFDDNSGKNILRFNSSGGQINASMKMFDYSGREVYRSGSINSSEIYLPDFIARGVYIVEVTREQKNYRLKVVVR